MITPEKYKRKIRDYLQSPEATDEVWEYVLESLLDVASIMGLDFLDEQILSKQELRERHGVITQLNESELGQPLTSTPEGGNLN